MRRELRGLRGVRRGPGGDNVQGLSHICLRFSPALRCSTMLGVHPALKLGDERGSFRQPDGTAAIGLGAVDGALEVERMASMRRNASSAIGEIGGASLPPRAFAAMSANSKNLRLACARRRASATDSGGRSSV